MKKFGGGKARPSPAMNVTPLVDIVLVLLIIFMVVLPSMEDDAPLEVPSIFNVDEEPEGRTDPITVSIDRDAQLYLEQDQLDTPTLEARLRELHESQPLRRVILRGDGDLAYRQVREVFAMCQSLGLPGVSLRVGERAQGANPSISPGEGE